MDGVNPAAPQAPAPGPNEPPPPYSENAPGAPPRHTNDIPLPDSPVTTHNPNPFPPPQQPQYQQPQTQPQRSSSAAQYFASRPSRPIQTIALPLRPNSVRADLYYPRDWAPDHDVSLQDWTTFVGFLIPDHVVLGDEKRLSPERRDAAEAVLREWNDGFFLPRGIRTTIDDGTGRQNSIPSRAGSSAGSAAQWSRQSRIPSQPGNSPYAQRPGGPEIRPTTSSAYHQPSNAPYRQSSTSSSHYAPPGSSRERWTQKLKDIAQEKDISVSQEGVRMADKFSLSLGGLKVGKFNLDERGMNYGGKPIGPTLPVAQHHGPPPPGPQGGYPGHGPAGSFGSGRGYGPPPQAGYGAPQYGAGPPMGQAHSPSQGHFAPPSGPPPPGQYPQQQSGTM